MGLIILLAVGALAGWLAAIVLKIELDRKILAHIAAGALGSLVIGLIANTGSIVWGMSPISVLAGFLGALAGITILNLFRNQLARH